jgi:hypothetical protein
MATGGIFQLITNDGKQDRMLMASALLKQRINDATAIRKANKEHDTTPTLYDIERTHIIFTNAHFKPFAAIGYEYNKVTNSAGTAALGGKITFSIPQFGDFFNDMVVHAIIEQPVLDTNDGNGAPVAASKQNLIRWCSYPGERLLKKVKFEVNGNPLDEYTSDATNYHREFMVQPNKELAWNRCVGQETEQVGFVDQPNWASSGVASGDIKYRTKMSGCSGNQTPTGVKTENVELFIPLLFWCNKDPRLAVPSVAIPYGQRFITLELASASELTGEVPRGYATGAADIWSESNIAAGGVIKTPANLKSIELYINNIFVNPEVHNIFIKRIAFTLIRVHRQQNHTSQGGGETVLLQNLKWPIEALFVGMRVRSYHNGVSSALTREHLDKWHTFCNVTRESRTTQGWCGSKATLAEYTLAQMFTGATTSAVIAPPVATALATMTLDAGSIIPRLQDGDTLTYTNAAGELVGPMTVSSIDGLVTTFTKSGSDIPNYTNSEIIATNPATAFKVVRCGSAELGYQVEVCTPNFRTVTIKAHGIPIYNLFPNGFFNAYIPYNYGGHNVRAPRDIGALLITFCLYPGTYQPSGHINISRAREFYIDYETTDNINSTNGSQGTLVVVASAINFLLISDGSAVLRYST